MYCGDTVLDLETLSPVGHLSMGGILAIDAEHGRIYARDGSDLLVFADQGGHPNPTLPPGESGPLRVHHIQSIRVSPVYATDRTLFVNTGTEIHRSTDGGRTWSRLRGGLPTTTTLDLEISPGFDRDRTLWGGPHIHR